MQYAKRPFDYGVEETLIAAIENIDHRLPNVLGVDVADAPMMVVQNADHIAPCRGKMPGVIE